MPEERSQRSAQQHHGEARTSPPLHDFDAEHDPAVSHRLSTLDRRRVAAAASPMIEMPEDYVGKSGIQTLAEFVANVERDITAATQGIDQVSSPEALIAGVCARVLDGFQEVEKVLDLSPPKGSTAVQLRVLMQRLDVAIGTLFTVARQHKIGMRDTGLENVFDREDHLRVRPDISVERTKRAERYYDADFGSVPRHEGPGPSGASIADDIKEGKAGDEPSNRDALIERIQALEHSMWFALDHAFVEASAAITEPEMPKDPSLLEKLAGVAVGVLLDRAGTALGGILDLASSGAKARRLLAAGRMKLRDHIGRGTAKALVSGFLGAGKEALIKGAKVGLEHAGKQDPKMPPIQQKSEFNPSKLQISPKQIYLLGAHQRTIGAKEAVSKAFVSLGGELRRLPVDVLRDLHESFNQSVFNMVADEFRNLLVEEWVNFVQAASADGYEMRDEATRERELGGSPSKLDNLLIPAGVVRIRVQLGQGGQVTFQDATLGGVSTTVVEAVKLMNRPLSSLAMHRQIELSSTNALTSPGGSFDVDPSGLVWSIDRITAAARHHVAAVLHPAREAVFNDGDVLGGAMALVQKLHIQTSASIKRVE